MTRSPRRQVPAGYRLRLDGHLDDYWSAWFGDLTLTHESDGTTSLSGVVADQAELHGLLVKIRDLGVTLISVELIDPTATSPSRHAHHLQKETVMTTTADGAPVSTGGPAADPRVASADVPGSRSRGRLLLEGGVLVALWIGVGQLLGVEVIGYLLLGIPVAVGFQLGVRRQPLQRDRPARRDIARSVRDAPRPHRPRNPEDRRADLRRAHRRVDELLDLVGLTDAGDLRVGGYSLGMRQRLGIAQTLVGEPQVLILDEPANGLDPEGIAWMRGLLRDFADRGGTVLLSSHLLHEVQATVDHLVVISAGAVVASGPLAQLLASSSLLLRTPDPKALARALGAARIDYRSGPDETFAVDVLDGRVTAEMIARVALEQQVLVTELRQSDSGGLEQLFFSLTATKTAHQQEAAA